MFREKWPQLPGTRRVDRTPGHTHTCTHMALWDSWRYTHTHGFMGQLAALPGQKELAMLSEGVEFGEPPGLAESSVP